MIAVLSGPEQRTLYRKVVACLEAAEGPDAALDRDIARLLGEPPGLGYTSDLAAVEARVRRAFPRGGWAVQEVPHVDARIWEDSPVEADSEFRSEAWRPPLDPLHMPMPPANTAIALTLALLRSMEEVFGC